MRRWIEEGWNKHNLAVIDEVYAPNFVLHEPELHLSIEDLIAEGDKGVWRFNSTGHQNGPFMGMPPSGKTGNITGIVIFRLENSRIAEAWVNIDVLGLLQQTGVIPMPG